MLLGQEAEAEEHAPALDTAFVIDSAAMGRSVLSRIELARRRAPEALAHAEKGLELLGQWPEALHVGTVLRLAKYEALVALGETEAAQTTILAARERIERIAATLRDPEDRRAFESIDANVRTLTLAGARTS